MNELNILENDSEIKNTSELKDTSEILSTNNLNRIKNNIENMDKIHHIEIYKILINDNKILFNENNNGIFINLTELSIDNIHKLENYIEYFNKQQKQLILLEKQKKEIQNNFFS